MKPRIQIPNRVLYDYAGSNGAMEVHRSWRDHMLIQHREVSKERMDWDTLPERDKQLDQRIALDVVFDFLVWYNAHMLEE